MANTKITWPRLSKKAKFLLFGHKIANIATLDQALHKFLN